MADLFRVAQAFAQEPDPIRVRFGKVVSIEANRTITVTIGGSTTSVSGVKYVASLCPLPGAVVMLMTDGADLFAFAHIAADGLTLAPRAYRSVDLTVAAATDVAVTWSGVNSDSWGCWSAGAPTRLTAPITGRYAATGNAKWASNGTGFRAIWIAKNGSEEVRTNQISAAAGSPTIVNVSSAPFNLTKGEYVELYVRQNSGADLAVTRDSDSQPSLGLRYLGP